MATLRDQLGLFKQALNDGRDFKKLATRLPEIRFFSYPGGSDATIDDAGEAVGQTTVFRADPAQTGDTEGLTRTEWRCTRLFGAFRWSVFGHSTQCEFWGVAQHHRRAVPIGRRQ